MEVSDGLVLRSMRAVRPNPNSSKWQTGFVYVEPKLGGTDTQFTSATAGALS